VSTPVGFDEAQRPNVWFGATYALGSYDGSWPI